MRADNDGLVVHEPAVTDRLLDAIAEHRLAKEGNGMSGGRGGKAYADRVEVLERITPDARLLCRVATVALIRDDEVEGVNRNVEFVSIVLALGVAARLRERSLAPKRFRAMRWMVET